VKKFLKEPGGADLYEELEIKWIMGHSPELVLYGEKDPSLEIERIDIAPYSGDELHMLLQEKGFTTSEKQRIMSSADTEVYEDDMEEEVCGKTKTQILVEERVANMSYLEVFLQAPIYNSGMTFACSGLVLLAFHLGKRFFCRDEVMDRLQKEIEESRIMRKRAAANIGIL